MTYWGTYYDMQRVLGAERTTELLNAADGAAICKAEATRALLEDREADMRAWMAFREMLARGAHRLVDGTVARVGLRVVKDRAWFDKRERMPAGYSSYDDRVRVITSTHFLETGCVDCGPSQYDTTQLRAAPASPTAGDDLLAAVRWCEMVNAECYADTIRALRAEAAGERPGAAT